MKCQRCSWPTSLWHQDLFSFDGLCGKCRRIARDKPEVDAQVAVQQALSGHVADLLNKGEAPEAIRSMMTANAFDRQTVSTVVDSAVAEWKIQKAQKDAEEEARHPKINCPICGRTMTAGRAIIRPSLTRTVFDVLGALTGGAGGGSGISDHLYFQRTEDGEQAEIPTGKEVPAHYCTDCQAFVILAKVPNRK